jgi:hypothetical protein
MSYFDEEREPPSKQGEKYLRPMGVNAPHYPNKFERKKLVQILQKSGGASEEEVRERKGNRQALAQARRSDYGNGSNKSRLALRRVRNEVAQRLGLNVNDPKVTAATMQEICAPSVRDRWFRRPTAAFQAAWAARGLKDKLNTPSRPRKKK